MSSKSSKTSTKTIRLTNEEWLELDYAAQLHGRTRNDEIRARIAQHAVEVPVEVVDGQMTIDEML